MEANKLRSAAVSAGLSALYTYLFLVSLTLAQFHWPYLTGSSFVLWAWTGSVFCLVFGVVYALTRSQPSKSEWGYLTWIFIFNALLLAGMIIPEWYAFEETPPTLESEEGSHPH